MGTTTGHRGGRRTRRLALAAGAIWVAGAFATSAPASSAECTLGMLLLRMCGPSATPAPGPAPVVTTPPTTAAPLLPPPTVSLPPVTVPPVAPPPAPTMTALEAARRLLDLTNAERQKAGVGALSSRDDLTAIAVAHSERMAQAGDIFHSDSFMSASVKSLLNAGVRGENVAYNGDIESAHARLMASAGHRANILDARFTVAGIGVVRHPDGRWFITEDFIQALGTARPAAARVAAPVVARAVASARPVTAARTASPTAAPAPPTTTPATVPPAPPAPVVPVEVPEVVPPAPARLDLSVQRAGAATGPLAGAGMALLGVALSACWMVPRRRRNG